MSDITNAHAIHPHTYTAPLPRNFRELPNRACASCGLMEFQAHADHRIIMTPRDGDVICAYCVEALAR